MPPSARMSEPMDLQTSGLIRPGPSAAEWGRKDKYLVWFLVILVLGFQVAQQRIVENVCQNVEVGGKLK